MKVKCLKGFATSKLSTYKGQVIEIADQVALIDLLGAGYVEVLEGQEEKKATKKKVVKSNEGK